MPDQLLDLTIRGDDPLRQQDYGRAAAGGGSYSGRIIEYNQVNVIAQDRGIA